MKKPHLLIAGTGRAGTSFLVKYLDELGLETHISRNKDAVFFDAAMAGLEDTPIIVDPEKIPYVAKSPWLYQVIDRLLEDKNFKIDGVIIPIRDLVEAATSRSIVELQNMHRSFPNMTKLDRAWSEWGATPGGIVYSADPLDQARILALGLHHLIEKLAEFDIPFVFLSFPKFIDEPEYLFKKLKKFLPETINKDKAIKAHYKIADKNKVRTTKELKGTKEAPKQMEIENFALKRELETYREEKEAYVKKLNDLLNELDILLLKSKELQEIVKTLESEKKFLEIESQELKLRITNLEKTINNMQVSTSWKITKPIRGAKRIIYKES